MGLELLQFRTSHFNEKARWALDHKGVPHRRTSLLPGPHARRVRRMSGQSATPVLCDDGAVIAGSAAIIAHLEDRFPEPPLFPADEAARAEALAIQAEFDDEVGPAIRRAKFATMIVDRDYFIRCFTHEEGRLAWLVYTAMFPRIRRLMSASMDFSDTAVTRGRERTRQAFDFVAERSAATGYLVGDAFSVADLTAAALLWPAVHAPEAPMRFPAPHSPSLERWLAEWADHPGADYVRRIYASHRQPASLAAAA